MRPQRARAIQPGGGLIETLLAQEESPGLQASLDGHGTCRWRAGIARTAAGDGDARHVDVVLHAEGQAKQRQVSEVMVASVQRAGPF